MSFENVKGFNNLTKNQKELLERVYKKHLRQMWEEDRGLYAIEKIKKVEWDNEENTVNIFFEDTWWHYNQNDTWY